MKRPPDDVTNFLLKTKRHAQVRGVLRSIEQGCTRSRILASCDQSRRELSDSDARCRSKLRIPTPYGAGGCVWLRGLDGAPLRSALSAVTTSWATPPRKRGTRSGRIAGRGCCDAPAGRRPDRPRRSFIWREASVHAGCGRAAFGGESSPALVPSPSAKEACGAAHETLSIAQNPSRLCTWHAGRIRYYPRDAIGAEADTGAY